MIDTNTN